MGEKANLEVAIGKIQNGGTIIFKGRTLIGSACIIDNSGIIEFGNNIMLGEGNTMLVRQKVSIGDYTRIGFHSFLMDSDEHYTINVATNTIVRNTAKIVLGNYNWIACKTFIKKGARTPDFTIVASANSVLSKDYSKFGTYNVLGGLPAKVIGSGIRRIYDIDHENQIKEFFANHPKEKEMKLDIESNDLDSFCLGNVL